MMAEILLGRDTKEVEYDSVLGQRIIEVNKKVNVKEDSN